MNLLNFIDRIDLEAMLPPFINLHTRNKDKAIEQCKDFFANYLHFTNVNHQTDRWQFFTARSAYNYYGGYQYNLKQSNDIWWLIRANDDYDEI